MSQTPALIYPYLAQETSTADIELLDLINSSVPRKLPATIRADVCQELALALLSGEISVAEIPSWLTKTIAKQFSFDPRHCRHLLISLDAINFTDKLDFRLQRQAPVSLHVYHRQYKAEWTKHHREQCRAHWRNYRARNLNVLRGKQCNSYRQKHNLSAEQFQQKLSPSLVLQMRYLYANGTSLGQITEASNLNSKTAYDAITGLTWTKLPLPDYSTRKGPNRGRHIPTRTAIFDSSRTAPALLKLGNHPGSPNLIRTIETHLQERGIKVGNRLYQPLVTEIVTITHATHGLINETTLPATVAEFVRAAIKREATADYLNSLEKPLPHIQPGPRNSRTRHPRKGLAE